MTHNLLEYNLIHDPDLERKVRTGGFRREGLFYEHKTATSGHIFAKECLDKFVKHNGQDPVLMEQDEVRNLAEMLTTNMNTFLVFKQTFSTDTPELIIQNYNLYAVYRKN